MKISITKISQDAILPKQHTKHSAGVDLHACIDVPIELKPMKRAVVPTGLAVALPDGYEGQIRARSGLARNHGIALVNGIGTIDADYRGEIGVLLINLGEETFTVEPGMRIAQFILSKYENIEWEERPSLDSTGRGESGFGSTDS